MTIRRWLVAVCTCVLAASTAFAQSPASTPTAPAGNASPPATPSGPASNASPAQDPSTRAAESSARSGQESAAPAPPPNYIYSPDGRRDPFVRTAGRFVAPSPNGNARPLGIAGLLVAEIVVRGFLESRGAWVAMVGAPDGRNYTLRTGDRLMDGVIRTITSEAVVILQDVNDPLSREKQREVRKYLRGGEQAQ